MKRFLLLFAGLVCCWGLGAQEPEREAPSGYEPHFLDWSVPNRSCRYEIRIAKVATSEDFDMVLPSGGYSAWNEFDMSRYEEGGKYQFTSPSVSVGISLNRFFQLSLSGHLSHFQQNYYDKFTAQPARVLDNTTLMTSSVVRFNFLNSRYMKGYVGVGLDAAYHVDRGSREMIASVCCNLGATYGARVFGYWDLSISNEFIVGQLGVGYRF
jgi:hypothetical protein